jgi:hypothetical protein
MASFLLIYCLFSTALFIALVEFIIKHDRKR